MKNIAVFVSGSGTNLEEILNRIEANELKVNCKAVICDKENAYARDRARNHGVDEFYLNPKAYPSKKEYEEAILEVLKEKEVDFLVLSGYMRFIGKTLLDAYPSKIINIHPALLPSFPGAHAIQDAYEAQVPFTGVTVHYVDEGVDTGPVIRQEKVELDPSWSLEQTEQAVHAKEYDLFYRVIQEVADLLEKSDRDCA
ncbi:phosphoribosylglycinamide formyltransferase [Ileibacterium valens]|uniref:phosphoribosylglycinamide formyltransferase n=1 Tax=Ileibacterium valens TaxID=1862668 RepID=UPI0025745306|nr:phosphoribosylglycinamide formyltransferase [Ileibacterium valens]